MAHVALRCAGVASLPTSVADAGVRCMPRPRWPLLLLLALRPLGAAAVVPDVEVPALGLSIATVPPGTSAPQVSERPGGSEMTLELGKAVMRIFRESGAVAPGSDVASPAYRA